ncbi:MAG: DUF4954 family protein [Rikenellaceae bacterium]
MMGFRELKVEERIELERRACFAEDWDQVIVSNCFSVSQLSLCRFAGRVIIGAGSRIHNSSIVNYALGEGCHIESVSLIECQGESSFGNGVSVASLNECGGRSIKIYDSLTAQIAYISTIYRHRTEVINRINSMVEEYATQHKSSMGSIGQAVRIVGAGIIRNVKIGNNVTIEGSSILSNATLLDGVYFGADVKAHDFIAVEGAKVDNGATIERCFVGENVILSNGFTAVDSLFFASSHCENGEAASVFAGPYTVSHHKSSLLIAGFFSFFNAGSGSNQSNHLFKCGPVHQGVHLRGCKFGSSAYVMLPAINGAFTSVIGSHNSHHDTSDFPFSYLVNKEGRSTIIPAANISSYGYQRDTEKWVKRDKRRVKRDILNLEPHNPYIATMVIDAINTTNQMLDKNPDAQSYIHNKAVISANNLQRGLSLYNKAIAASLGEMLSYDDPSREGLGRCRWVDVAGQYITKSYMESTLDAVERGELNSLDQIDQLFGEFARSYNAYAYDWAVGILTELLGHAPSTEEIASTIKAASRTQEEILAMANRDKMRDSSDAMSISYGMDSGKNIEERLADFRAVRDL